MKKKIHFCVFASALAFVTGCDNSDNSSKDLEILDRAIGHFQQSNGKTVCPTISQLFQDGFINPNKSGYGAIKESVDRYNISTNAEGVCKAFVIK